MNKGEATSGNAAFLHHPHEKVSWSDALDLFEYSSIVIECERPQNLAEFPDLPVRLRGALGRMLYNYGKAIKHRYDPFSRLTPFDFLFGDHGYHKAHAPFPRPMVVRGSIRKNRFVVKVHLLGHAQYYASQVLECMARALDSGISLSDQVRVRTPVRICDAWLERSGRLQPPATAGSATLSFNTPLCVRKGNIITIAVGAFCNSLVNRAEGLVRWLGVEVDMIDLNLSRLITKIDVDVDNMHYISWLRHSIRQKGTSIPMAGFTGRLLLGGNIESIIPALKICEIFGTGSHAGLGLGWYDMAVYPGRSTGG